MKINDMDQILLWLQIINEKKMKKKPETKMAKIEGIERERERVGGKCFVLFSDSEHRTFFCFEFSFFET